MKTSNNFLLAGMLAAFGCSLANAQVNYSSALSLSGATLIYSNSFNGAAVTVNGTAPTVANNVLGGSSSATWNVVSNNAAVGAYLYQDGTVGLLGNSYLLPFTPQTNYIYILTASANLPSMTGGKWINWGFAQFANAKSTSPRFADSAVNGYDFTIGTCGSGSEQYWAGPRAGGYGVSAQLMPTAGNHILQIILDTSLTNFVGTTNWVGASFVDGQQLGTNWVFTTGLPIGAAGLGQTTLSSSANIQYIYFTLAATPFVIGQQPVSANLGAGAAFTNKVVVAGTKPAYQWFFNTVSNYAGASVMANTPDGRIYGTTNASLVFTNAHLSDAGFYYVVITNSVGSITSALASLTVATKPEFLAAYPTAYTNPITLFGGSNVGGTNGASPTFSVVAIGDQPITYQWLTNGVVVAGATSASFVITNCQLSSPTNVVCIATNIGGKATNAWSVSYVQAPSAPYPQILLGYQPLTYWRLNEAEVGGGDNGVLALDYGGGNNGIYTNAYLGVAGSSLTEPSTSAAYFGSAVTPDSDAFDIQGVDFGAPPGTNAVFSVTAWVLANPTQTSGAGILAKGYGGAEQFVLDVSGNKYRFALRDAAGNLYSATAPVGPSGNWDYLVGVCDEVHSNVTLYVNGVPLVSAAIAPGSGLLASSVPMTIGARSSTPTVGHNDLQFKGYVDDVAVFKSALSAGQEVNLYTNAGYSFSVYYVPPPSTVVYQANKTLTIPASAFGTTDLAYYWTDTTTGAFLGSGSINTWGTLDATLTVPNASTSLSGDQLQLVITNGTGFLNSWNVSLFTPAPPVTLDYSDTILYSNYFNGGAWSIAGMPLTAANALVGGTNTTWVNALGTNDTGTIQANGVDATSAQDSWELPFTPRAGYVYTVSASLTFTGNPNNWVGLGFAQRIPTNAAVGYGRFSDGGATPPQSGPNGYDWIILTESGGTMQYFTGPGGSPPAGVASGPFFASGAGTHLVTVVLDTTGAQWQYSASIDGVSTATFTYSSNPPIGAVGITQTTLNPPTVVQWNYFALTQVAPGGVPPYLLAPLPPTSVTLLADTSLSIPVRAFGSVPLGYYWSNTNTGAVLGSGTTNNVAPLVANLSVSDVPVSWNGNTLALTVTNAYGTNISLVSLTVTNAVNPHPGPVQISSAGGLITLSWPTNLGWTLLAQSNGPGVGLGTNWVVVPGSTTISNLVFPVSPTNGSVFYRLRL